MQFAYAGVPLSLSLLLNLANRRRIEVSTHQRAMGAVVRVQQQLTQDLAAIERRLRVVAERNEIARPTQSQIRLEQLHDLPHDDSQSQVRVRDLDDFRLIYQEIVSLQEQHRHVYESLAATIDYLNDSPLPQRVDEIEVQLDRLRYDFAALGDRLARRLQIDAVRHGEAAEDWPISSDALDEVFEAGQVDLERRSPSLPLENFVSSIDAEADEIAEPIAESLLDDTSMASGSDRMDTIDVDFFSDEVEESEAGGAEFGGAGTDAITDTSKEGTAESRAASSDRPASQPLTLPQFGSPAPAGEEAWGIAPIDVGDRAATASEAKLGATLKSGSPLSYSISGTESISTDAPSDSALSQTSIQPPSQTSSQTSAASHTPDLPEIADLDAASVASTAADDDTPRVPPQDWQRLSTLTDHGDWVSALAIDASGEVLVSASFDRTIQFWDIKTGESLNILSQQHSSPVCAIALNHDLGWLVSGSWDRTIKIWDFDTQTLLETLVDDSGVAGSVRSLAVSPNGRFVASGWFDRTIAIWEVRVTPKRRKVNVSACGSQVAHSGRVDAIAFSPAGSLLASASADGTVKLWSVDDDTGELEELRTFADSADPVNAVAFSRDGTLLVEANRDRAIRIWDVESGEQRHRLTGHSGSVTALAVHPDGETLISASSDGTVRLWDLPTGQTVATLNGRRDAVMSVSVSEDGQLIVSGSADGSIDVWRRWGRAELP